MDPRGFAQVGAFAAHAAPVSCMALHPSLPMVVTGALRCHAQDSASSLYMSNTGNKQALGLVLWEAAGYAIHTVSHAISLPCVR